MPSNKQQPGWRVRTALVAVGVGVGVVLAAGCAPETVEESQARRMNGLQQNSYSQQKMDANPTGQGDPLPASQNRGLSGTPANANGRSEMLPLDP